MVTDRQDVESTLFESSSRIFLNCCDMLNLFAFSVPSLPFLIINGLFAYFNLERKFPRKDVCAVCHWGRKLDALKTPSVLNVKPSVDFELGYKIFPFLIMHYREDICLQTLLLFANHMSKRPFVSTANEALVGTLMTIGHAKDIFPLGKFECIWGLKHRHSKVCEYFPLALQIVLFML